MAYKFDLNECQAISLEKKCRYASLILVTYLNYRNSRWTKLY